MLFYSKQMQSAEGCSIVGIGSFCITQGFSFEDLSDCNELKQSRR